MLGLLIGGLFSFLFVGALLMLYFGAQSIGEELEKRAREARELQARATRVSRFFVVQPPPRPETGKIDEAFVWQVQRYLDAEQTFADEFVLEPSLESLYRESGRRLTGH